MSKNLRDYGLGNYTEFVIGRPYDHAGHITSADSAGSCVNSIANPAASVNPKP